MVGVGHFGVESRWFSMNINMEDIKSVIIDLIDDNKENCELPFYDEGGYDAGYTDGYNDGLVDLLNRLGIKHHEQIMND